MRTLYDDNLRFFESQPPWRDAYESSLVRLTIRAETAFGALYVRDPHGRLHLLDPEVRTLTDTGCDEAELLELFAEDPANYIDQALYARCCDAYGRPSLDRHFAYRHPLALGGVQEVGNVVVMDAGEHMRFLGAISLQIADMPAGTQFHPIEA